MLRIALLSTLVLGAACDSTKPAPVPPAAAAPETKPPAAAPTPATKPGWVAYVQPQKLFSATYPAKPQESDSKADTPAGPIDVKMAIYAQGAGAYVAMATVYELPKGSSFDVQKALDGARNGMMSKINGKITSEAPSKLDGYEGRELSFEGPAPGGKVLRGKARVYAGTDPPTAFGAFVFDANAEPGEDAAAFLGSLHVGRGVAK